MFKVKKNTNKSETDWNTGRLTLESVCITGRELWDLDERKQIGNCS